METRIWSGRSTVESVWSTKLLMMLNIIKYFLYSESIDHFPLYDPMNSGHDEPMGTGFLSY